MFKVVIFSSDQTSFEEQKNKLLNLQVTPTKIIWANSKLISREQVVNQYLNQWLLFLDYDCEISAKTLSYVEKNICYQHINTNRVYTGRYLNPFNANTLQRAHNFIANNWVMQSYEFSEANKLVLGGIFLINSSEQIIKKENELIWGAEDKVLSYQLNCQNFEFHFDNQLVVTHSTSRSFAHFMRRAYLHGINEIKYISNNKNQTKYLYWIRKIGFANLSLTPLILLHFGVQRVAKIAQKVHLMNRLTK